MDKEFLLFFRKWLIKANKKEIGWYGLPGAGQLCFYAIPPISWRSYLLLGSARKTSPIQVSQGETKAPVRLRASSYFKLKYFLLDITYLPKPRVLESSFPPLKKVPRNFNLVWMIYGAWRWEGYRAWSLRHYWINVGLDIFSLLPPSEGIFWQAKWTSMPSDLRAETKMGRRTMKGVSCSASWEVSKNLV